MVNYPDELNIIFDKLYKHHIKAIIVGGFVRDSLLKIVSKDIDIELYGLSSINELENLLNEFGDVNSVGKSFGVCILSLKNITIDFTLPRVDNKTTAGHRGFEVSIDKDMDFKTAASRRDFTINAIGYDVHNRKILDPFGGQKDLKEKVLREVNRKTFVEDPLRVLRGVQFCARFGLTMSSTLFSLCRDMVKRGLLKELSKERIHVEYAKLLLSSKPSIGFKLLQELRILELQDFNVVTARVDYFSKIKTDNAKTNTLIMLAILSYPLSKDETSLFILKFSAEKKITDKIFLLHKSYKELLLINQNNLKNYSLYKLAKKIKISELLLFAQAIECNESKNSKILNRAKELNILNTSLEPLLGGNDIINLGLLPSNKFSEILKSAYEAQMHAEFSSHKGATLWLKSYLT